MNIKRNWRAGMAKAGVLVAGHLIPAPLALGCAAGDSLEVGLMCGPGTVEDGSLCVADDSMGGGGSGTGSSGGGSGTGSSGDGSGAVGSSGELGNPGSGGSSGAGSAPACDVGATRNCFDGDPSLAGIGACVLGMQTCEQVIHGEFVSIRWGTCMGSGMPQAEQCGNGMDDNCDGVVDEGCSPPPDPCAVGRAAEIGCGRAFIWGDEHVIFDTYWPAQRPFWVNAVAWLRAPGSCGPARTTIRFFGQNPPSQLVADLQAEGVNVGPPGNGIPTASDLAASDTMFVVEMGYVSPTPADGANLAAFVQGGGALMTTVVGLGSADPQECADANPALTPLGMEYSCFNPAPWGPIASFGSHPIATGLVPLNAPFENGRFVVDKGAGSWVVASISGTCPP